MLPRDVCFCHGDGKRSEGRFFDYRKCRRFEFALPRTIRLSSCGDFDLAHGLQDGLDEAFGWDSNLKIRLGFEPGNPGASGNVVIRGVETLIGSLKKHFGRSTFARIGDAGAV